MSTVDLPSGLVGDVRKIRGVELAQIAAQSEGTGAADGGFAGLLSACWVATVDPGPYPFVRAGDAKPDWNRMLKGDLLAGVVHLRRISVMDGDDFDFDVRCEECRKRIAWSKKLSELPMRRLSPEGQERLRTGQPFEAVVDRDGAKVRVAFQLGTVAQEEPITRLMKQTNRKVATIVDACCTRVVGVEGVKPDIKSRWRWLSELDWGALQQLQADMDEFDCGLDTSVEIRCQEPDCQWEQEVNLPLLNRRFFSPKKRPKTPNPAAFDGGEHSSEHDASASGGLSDVTTFGGTNMAARATAG